MHLIFDLQVCQPEVAEGGFIRCDRLRQAANDMFIPIIKYR